MSDRVVVGMNTLVVVVCCSVVPACRTPDADKTAKPAPISVRTEAKMPVTATEARAPAEPTQAQAGPKQEAPGASSSESELPVVAIADAENTTTGTTTETPSTPSGDSLDDGEAVAPAETDKAASRRQLVTPLDEQADRLTEEEHAAIEARREPRRNLQPRARDALDMTERDILAKWDKLQSLSVVVTTTLDTGPPDERRVTTGHGVYDMKKAEGFPFIRFDLLAESESPEGGPGSAQTERIVSVVNGELMYGLAEKNGRFKAYKMALDTSQPALLGGRRLFHRLHTLYDARLLPEETFEGRPAYVIGATLDEYGKENKYYFDKETGVLVKLVMDVDCGKQTRVYSFSNIQINPTFPEDHFVFEAPKGVRLWDYTKMKRGEKRQ